MKRPRLLLAVILVAVAALLGSLWVGEGPLCAGCDAEAGTSRGDFGHL